MLLVGRTQQVDIHRDADADACGARPQLGDLIDRELRQPDDDVQPGLLARLPATIRYGVPLAVVAGLLFGAWSWWDEA